MDHQIVVGQTFAVGIESLWQAWADEKIVSRWFTTNAKQDFREGGAYDNGDGDKGTFLRIVPHELLQFSWDNEKHSPGTVVTITFRTLGAEASELELVHRGLADEACARDMSKGWNWAMDSVKLFLETGQPIGFEEWEKTSLHHSFGVSLTDNSPASSKSRKKHER